jgi:predicted nuclease of predicted toxin-antitoxin system
MQAAPDEAVLKQARSGEQILISADTDFGSILSRSKASNPSVILIRRLVGRRAEQQAAIILANLDQVTEDLAAGAVVVIHEDLLRVRRLPMPG